MTVRVRAERFGAWARVDDATLVALDRAAAARLGVDGGTLWEGLPGTTSDRPVAPLELHVAVTSKCPASCSGCYLDARPDGAEVALEDLDATLAAAAELGVFTIAFGGGEPLTHPDLGELARVARRHGLVPVVTISGLGLTLDKARGLRDFAQVNVSHDGADGAYESVRGFDGAPVAERAMRLLVEAGVAVGANVVLTRDTFERVEETAARLAACGARELQLLRWKPAGRAASLDYLARRLSPAQVLALPSVLDRLAARAREGGPAIRIDCALVPFLSTRFDDAEALRRVGVMGCEASGALSAVKIDGRLAPCSFADALEVDARSTTALEAAFDARGAAFGRWRSHADAPAEPCASCTLRPVCRGGCKIVSAHLTDDRFAPDPECPRVRAHRADALAPALG
jgi:radical SAM protein with 4Fe4S-binding SPASM domain